MRRGSKSNEIRVFCRRLPRVGVEGRLKPDAFMMLMARLKPCPCSKADLMCVDILRV
jgi:hypothetical protein